ncbi:hypothetical protein Tco_1187744 [Tanacetum coccineum]
MNPLSFHTLYVLSKRRGAVSGTTLSYKLTKATFDHLNSDNDDELGLAINLVMIIYGHLEIILGDDEHKIMGIYKAPLGKGYSLKWTHQSYWSWKHCDY